MSIAGRYNRLGIRSFTNKEYLRAVYWFKNASAWEPEESGYLYNIGNTYCRMVLDRGSRTQDDAVKYLMKAANLNHGTACYVLGNIFNPDLWPEFSGKNVERALRFYEKARDNISPDKPIMASVLNNLGCCCGKKGRLAEAAAYCYLAWKAGLEAAEKNYQTYICQIPEHWRAAIATISSPQEILDGVRNDINEFVGDAPQFDDLTMLGLKIRSLASGNKDESADES